MKREIACSNTMGRVAKDHDLRITVSHNVDPELMKDNVTIEDNLNGKEINDYIDELLQPAINEYNAKQKRKERRIEMSYTEWHKQNENKGDLVYELVMQYGEHKNLGAMYYNGDEETKKKMRKEFEEIYRKWFNEWKKQHPNLKVLWSVIHFDERNGTPHMHIAVCPICQNFKRGPKMQVSMSKALEDDGFKRSDSRKEGYQLERAYNEFRKYQEAMLGEYGYVLKERTDEKHRDLELFREVEAAKDELEQTQIEMQQAKNVIQCANAIKQVLEEETQNIIPHKDLKVTKTQVKETVFSKPQTVYQMEEETYQSINSEQNVKRLSEAAERAAERIERISEQTLDSIESAANKALQQRVEELEKEVYQQRSTIIKQRTTIEQLSSIIENVKTFIRELNLTHLWNRFMERIREQEQTKERTR